MISIFSHLKGLFTKTKDKSSDVDAEALRVLFRARYHNFKRLLSANAKALFIMSDIEKALRGNDVFGMTFIKAKCTEVLVNVYSIIKNLDELAPNKYTALYDVFSDVKKQLDILIEIKSTVKTDRAVIGLSETTLEFSDHVGSKMANLGEIKSKTNLLVPDGFVITSYAYNKFFAHNGLESEIGRQLQVVEEDSVDAMYAASSRIQQLIINAVMPEDIEREIMRAYNDIGKEGLKVCLRSSALAEDSMRTSFAGQYSTKLNITKDNIIDSYKEVVASKYNVTAITYRLHKGILDEEVAMCVGCMEIIDARSGGVLYTANPMDSQDDSIIIDSAWGLPKSVVDGTVETDEFIVSRTAPFEIVKQRIGLKDNKLVCNDGEGIRRIKISEEEGYRSSLTDDEVVKLAALAIELETLYGLPLDVEWAFRLDGSLYVLQCRPLKRNHRRLNRPDVAPDILLAELKIAEGGIGASPGAAFGEVFVIRKNADMLMFPPGAVLVTRQALPQVATLMSKAAAIITEQGSAVGHLANVAREFRVPAIFALPAAMEIFKNGDSITVDADGLKIYRGKIDSIIESGLRDDEIGFMKDSPVYDILKNVASYIVPLTLLNPDDVSFIAKNCKSLHDITRFCHENSVKELFNFGKDHFFSERSSKRLKCGAAMNWWFINLDDGFKEDVKGKYVHIENLVSVPFLALWEGFNAISWQGPPPVDGKGFMSILHEAATNTNLDPAMMSNYADKNYILVSRHFCSLSSRLGFHLANVEALVGERQGENYASFFFKGGAADYTRRVRRAMFLASILEEFGFTTQVREDALSARVDKEDEDYMVRQLKILGYLLMHSRQLDMIMTNNRSVASYKEKLTGDIQKIISPINSGMNSGFIKR
ncbi:MAG: hypothetical protein L3V56_08385 [Candidatus Magnetoovum sp. WYHC-5]|nr:hypothetical protein [Candidatus Magnetoovum sp. WYHC-5]